MCHVRPVPAGGRFEFIPFATLVNISDVELRVDGCLAGYDPSARGETYDDVWPRTGGGFRSMLSIRRSRRVTISGAGALDGRGVEGRSGRSGVVHRGRAGNFKENGAKQNSKQIFYFVGCSEQ